MTAQAERAAFTIALDAMGGDQAPEMVVAGAEIARVRHPDIRFLVYGDPARIERLLARHPQLASVSQVEPAADVIANDMKPSVALRAGRNSSMRLAINAVADGRADCIISAGNTGALMAMAKFVLKALPGIDRPAIASFFPTLRGESVMLDLGANIDCDVDNLVQFGVMGAIFAKVVLGLPEPRVGMLNVGAEEVKGNETVRGAAAELAQVPLPGVWHGFVEGDDIPQGTVDVVVTDGFTGNVALKTAEGTARLYTEWLRATFKSSLAAKLGYLLARGAFARLRRRTDPRRYNGAMFLGLQGICVKSHGGTDATGFANAIDVAVDLVQYGFNSQVREELARFEADRARLSAETPAPSPPDGPSLDASPAQIGAAQPDAAQANAVQIGAVQPETVPTPGAEPKADRS